MARVKSTASRKHREMLKEARGYGQARHKRIQTAKEAILHAGMYAYVGRKNKKRDLRALWITRISAACKAHGVSYSKFIDGLKKSKIEVDRKILSDIVARDPKTFEKIIKEAGFSFTSAK